MSDARTRMLQAVRAATRDVAGGEPAAHDVPTPSAQPADLALLAARIADYRATVTRVSERGVDAVAAALARHAAERVAIDSGLPPELRPATVDLIADDPPLTHEALAAVDGVLTTAALAIAQTGTIVLDHSAGQGRRALTLLPDLHVCVLHARQVRQTVPQAIAALTATTRPVTFISGPSATSDIELDRVEGVHGPRRLEVVIVG